MLNEIENCQKCDICKLQKPLIEKGIEKADVMWIGLSATLSNQKSFRPLSPDTPTGKIISMIEDKCLCNGNDISFYHTNAVKCTPYDEKTSRLRYPNNLEMGNCFQYLADEIHIISPTLVFLLGIKVSGFIAGKLGISFGKITNYGYRTVTYDGIQYIPIHHPSYINIYKRGEIKEYTDAVTDMILKHCQ